MDSVAGGFVGDLTAQVGDVVVDDDLVDAGVEIFLEQREPNVLFYFGCHADAEAELGVDGLDFGNTEGCFDRENLLSGALDDTGQGDDAVVGAHVDGLEVVESEGSPDPFGEPVIVARLGCRKSGGAQSSENEKQSCRTPSHRPLF